MTKRILNENEMDRAQLILAAKAVVDDIQVMAEKMAKMEADGIMPLLDGIRMQFGPDFADRLNQDATAALRASLEAIKATKESIGKNITNMEQMVTGEGPGNDMATGAGLDQPEAPQAPAAAVPDQVADIEGEVPSEGGEGGDDIDDVFGSGDVPMGRDTKESVIARNINMLRESANPDRMIMAQVMQRLHRGQKAKVAVVETAKSFGIDAQDVVAIIKENTHQKQK